MSKQGRPKFRNYDTAVTIRMTRRTLAELHFEYDQFCATHGQWNKRGRKRSFNEFLIKRLGCKNDRTDKRAIATI